MRHRIGLTAAFCVGYLLGTRAGHERYREIVRAVGRARRSSPVTGTAALVGSKTRAATSLGVERMKDTIGVRLGWRNGDEAADAIALDLAEDLATAINGRRR